MSRDPTADDAAALLLAIIANRPNTPKTEAFTPVATDAERAGLEYHPARLLRIIPRRGSAPLW
jgi:hypothetical protein